MIRFLLLLALLIGPAAPRAQEAGQFSSVRLDGVGTLPGEPGLWAILTMTIAPGWKTYWRNPGDAGVAPLFDWSGSINLAAAEVAWPAPKRFFDGYSHSIGYSGPEVLLPVRIEPTAPDRPVALSLTLRYAVCEKICIPEKAELSGFVRAEPGGTGPAAALKAALAAVPRTVSAPVEGKPGVASAEIGDDGETLTVTLNRFSGADKADVFVHGPDGKPMLMATRTASEPDSVFSQPLDGIATENRVAGKAYHFTVVWPGGAVEQTLAVR